MKTKNIREKVLKGLELTHKRLIKSKKERNFDLVVSQNGQIVTIRAKDLVL
ncbi:hypothetical protein [Geofilum rubicundum]|jgi:hypothetical protein|uniref:Uncharacterized protein n=1 Tax=Geofilum rubicundum JCM 15548 TaxID=1236989 RepID=A0A0E9LZ09_9BACT|nr:hypothetical protein [Geofilum rubicundum]GAO30474.1 hypothetical protein JCM15548_12745 [Geofilum rubicundum JCM 15548]